MFATPAEASSLLKSGKVRGLAVLFDERLPDFPDLPTLKEAGFAGMESLVGWYGVFFPKGTPAELVAGMLANMRALATEREFSDNVRSLGLQPAAPGSPADFAERIRSDGARVRELTRSTGLQQ